MFKEELHRRVGDDGATHFATHKVFNFLGDSSEAKIVFTGAFSETEEEVGGVVVFHELPGLINDEHAAFLFGADNIPDVGKDDVHSNRAEFVFEIANVEDDHGVVDVDIGLLREDAGKSTCGVFAKALGELGAGTAHMEKGIVEINNGRGCALMGERIAGDAGAGVSIDESLVEVSFFVGGEGGGDLTIGGDLVATKHEAEKAMKSDEVGTQGVISVFAINDTREIEGINADIGVEAEADITAADSVTETLVFVFGIDDDNFGADHHGAKSFEFDSKRFTGTRLCEDDKVGVFEAKTVENDETVVVHIDAVEDAFFLGEVGRSEGETSGNGAGVHVAADLELVGTLGHSTIHSLLLLGSGNFTKDHELAEEGFDFVLDEVKFVERVGPESNIETEPEEFFFADLEFVAEFFGVLDGGFEFRVANFAFLGIDVVAGFELGNFFAEVAHDDGGFDWINIHGDINNFIDVDETGDPASEEFAGVAINIDSAAIFVAKTEIIGVDFDRTGRNEIAEGGNSLLKGLTDFGVFGGLGLGGKIGCGELLFLKFSSFAFFSTHFDVLL